MASPETKEIPKPPEGVTERQEDFVIAEKIQDIAKPTQTQVTATVTDDDEDLIQTPQKKQVNIEIPAPQETIESWSKGSPSDSQTWSGFFWIRMIKKALHFGWKVFLGGNNVGSDDPNNDDAKVQAEVNDEQSTQDETGNKQDNTG